MQTKKMQLFILPYAGGSIASFKKLTDLVDDTIETISVEYTGRGKRIKEPLLDSIGDMLNDAISYCKERRNPEIPYAIMGYSMGSILAYEMLIKDVFGEEPSHLFIAAEVSPKQRSQELEKLGSPTEEQILARAKSLGGMDERLLSNKRFADIYIKPMVSDYRNFFGYRFANYKERVKVDTTYFYCEKDTSREDVEKWGELIEGKFDFHEYGENHFFINQYYKEMAQVINEILCH